MFSKPECLIYTDTDGKLRIEQETLTQVAALTDKTLVVVAIAGIYRTGKSYLMNRLAGGNHGFSLGSTIESKTKGIWIWVREHPIHSDKYLVLLDTEGLGDVSKGDDTHDCQVFSLATLLCSVLVYNAMGPITDDSLDKLDGLSEHICTRARQDMEETDANFDYHFPHFIYALRDFALELKIDEQDVTEDEYLEHCLKLKKETDHKAELPRKFIRKYFKQRHCFTFDRPAGRLALSHLEDLSDNELSTDFVKETKSFCDHVYKHGVEKTLETGQAFDGQMWAVIVECYVKAIREGSVPCIESGIVALATIENQRGIDMGVKVYQDMMKMVKLPTPTEETLATAHSAALSSAIHVFLSKAINDTENRYLQKLNDIIDEEYRKVQMDNEQKSTSACDSCLSKLDEQFLGNTGEYAKAGGYADYTAAVHRVEESFKKTGGLGVMAEKTLDVNLAKKALEGKRILMADQQISEKERQAEEARKQAEAAERQKTLAQKAKREIEERGKRREAQLKGELKQVEAKSEREMKEVEMRHEETLSKRLKEQDTLLKEGFEQDAKEVQEQIEKQKTEVAIIKKDHADKKMRQQQLWHNRALAAAATATAETVAATKAVALATTAAKKATVEAAEATNEALKAATQATAAAIVAASRTTTRAVTDGATAATKGAATAASATAAATRTAANAVTEGASAATKATAATAATVINKVKFW